MALTPDPPYPKNPGDPIRSKDWNDLVVETQRLEIAKLNRSGDILRGTLALEGVLQLQGTQAPVDHDGALYKDTTGRVSLTIDDEFIIRKPGSTTPSLTLDASNGTLQLCAQEDLSGKVKPNILTLGTNYQFSHRSTGGNALALNIPNNAAFEISNGSNTLLQVNGSNGDLRASGTAYFPNGINFECLTPHKNVDGALYRATDGQCYLTVDDYFRFRNVNASRHSLEINTTIGSLHLASDTALNGNTVENILAIGNPLSFTISQHADSLTFNIHESKYMTVNNSNKQLLKLDGISGDLHTFGSFYLDGNMQFAHTAINNINALGDLRIDTGSTLSVAAKGFIYISTQNSLTIDSQDAIYINPKTGASIGGSVTVGTGLSISSYAYPNGCIRLYGPELTNLMYVFGDAFFSGRVRDAKLVMTATSTILGIITINNGMSGEFQDLNLQFTSPLSANYLILFQIYRVVCLTDGAGVEILIKLDGRIIYSDEFNFGRQFQQEALRGTFIYPIPSGTHKLSLHWVGVNSSYDLEGFCQTEGSDHYLSIIEL